MHQITEFEEVRADGRAIPAAMTLEELLAKNWPRLKVVALRWCSNGTQVGYSAPGSVAGIVVPGNGFVAAMTFDGPSVENTRLLILLSNGTEHATIEPHARHMGADRRGYWNWFEPAINPRADVFGAVLTTLFDGDFLCDIDARTAQVLAVRRTR